ncbi:hypothetical protein AB0D04_25085 [Streptomyces sp. NPDC048483]|uniref:hypothetical protein n=1 Tax=Streptomyces sp. NPDC048483 TaxID=3154927 RepID=UPI00341CD244
MSVDVRDVVSDVVAQQAPEELPLVDGLARLDHDEAVRLLKRRNTSAPLGFGLSEIAAVITPVVWIAVDEACRASVGRLMGRVTPRLAALGRRMLRRPPAPSPEVPALTAEQLNSVHRRVCEGAARAGLEGAAVEALADCVVARLALERDALPAVSPPAEPEPEAGPHVGGAS